MTKTNTPAPHKTLDRLQAPDSDPLFEQVRAAMAPRGLPRDLARLSAHIDDVEALLRDDSYSSCVKEHFIEALVDVEQRLKDAAFRLGQAISSTGLR